MISKKVTVNNSEYEIRIVKLLDNSLEAGIFQSEKLKAKMTLSAIDSSDIRNVAGEDPSQLIFNLMESYAKSGFILGMA
jgi:hypothetical protein